MTFPPACPKTPIVEMGLATGGREQAMGNLGAASSWGRQSSLPQPSTTDNRVGAKYLQLPPDLLEHQLMGPSPGRVSRKQPLVQSAGWGQG